MAAVTITAGSQHFAASCGLETELDWLLRCQMTPSELAPGCLDLTLPASQVGDRLVQCPASVWAKRMRAGLLKSPTGAGLCIFC